MKFDLFTNISYKIGGIGFHYKHIRQLMPDRMFLKLAYAKQFGERLNLDNPVTFNEKLQWLKIYDRNPLYTTLVDKYAVKKYVANILGEQHVIPNIALYESVDEIEWDALPNRFVIKCTHDSGSTILCPDKNNFDLDAARVKLQRCLSNDFYSINREWPYKNVPHRIIVEEFLSESVNKDTLNDFKFFCFNGRVEFYKIDFDRFTNHGANYYDRNGELLPLGEVYCPCNPDKNLVIPSTVGQMIAFAEQLASGIPFVRVDFYDVNDIVLFGEMTFFPMAGMGKFEPEEWDCRIGEMLKLPEKK